MSCYFALRYSTCMLFAYESRLLWSLHWERDLTLSRCPQRWPEGVAICGWFRMISSENVWIFVGSLEFSLMRSRLYRAVNSLFLSLLCPYLRIVSGKGMPAVPLLELRSWRQFRLQGLSRLRVFRRRICWKFYIFLPFWGGRVPNGWIIE